MQVTDQLQTLQINFCEKPYTICNSYVTPTKVKNRAVNIKNF
jgi:hypothetical protein